MTKGYTFINFLSTVAVIKMVTNTACTDGSYRDSVLGGGEIMPDTVQGSDKKEQRPRHRSPNYPSIGLKTAVAKITALYKQDGLAPSQKLAAIKHMGYDKFHSDAARAVSAIKSFGLIEEIDQRLKITQRGIDIVAREVGDPRRTEAIQVAALSPEIYKELATYYKDTGIPSDPTLRSELIAVRKFNPDSVNSMMRAFKETLDFALLPKIGAIQSQEEDGANSGERPGPKIGDLVQWESGGQIQFIEPRKIRDFSSDGLWAFVEGDSTGLPVGELTITEVASVEAIGQTPSVPPILNAQIQAKPEKPLHLTPPPQMRSYSWALSGVFNAKMDLFGEAETEEDLDALKDYVEITIKALKRSLKSRAATV